MYFLKPETLHDFRNLIRSLHVTLRDMDLINLATTCVDCTMIDEYKNKMSSPCASGKQKEHDKSLFSSCICMCPEKKEAVKEEGISA